MGSPSDELCRSELNEAPHRARLTRAFEIQATETTQDAFSARMGYNPSKHSCTSCPVESVSWHEAVAYCNALSQARGLASCYSCSGAAGAMRCTEAAAFPTPQQCPGFRLPTEAEWEYAYRAGTTTATYAGMLTRCDVAFDAALDPIAWYGKNATESHPTGTKGANALGLYDMAGNVSEWVADWYADDIVSQPEADPFHAMPTEWRGLRGGSFDEANALLRAAARSADLPDVGYFTIGFRCARTLNP